MNTSIINYTDRSFVKNVRIMSTLNTQQTRSFSKFLKMVSTWEMTVFFVLSPVSGARYYHVQTTS